MKNKELIQEAYDILKVIPPKKWITWRYGEIEGENFCAMGHLNKYYSKGKSSYISSKGNKINNIATKFLIRKYNLDKCIPNVNDSTNVNGYKQKAPKARVLKLLKDILKEET